MIRRLAALSFAAPLFALPALADDVSPRQAASGALESAATRPEGAPRLFDGGGGRASITAIPRTQFEALSRARRPSRPGLVASPSPASQASTLAQAAAMAREAIRKDSYEVSMPGKPGLRRITTAGSRQYKSLWTRDASFAGFGLLGEPGGTATVHDVLGCLFDRENAAGQLPRRQGSASNALTFLRSFLGLKVPAPKSLRSADYDGTLGPPQLDATALPIILAAAYDGSTGDKGFLARYYPAIKKASVFFQVRREPTALSARRAARTGKT